MDDDIRELGPDAFPPLLAEIPEPPARLWLRGSLPSPERAWLTVVGTRAYTPYGKQAVEHLIAGLAGAPVVIVSGLALGIDALAHEAALRAGIPTVAIPGSGLEWRVLYPRTNVSLARRIIAAGGAHLSEYEPGFRAQKWSFLRRNRLMAGIAHATLIIEAAEKSGTLVTARLAADYNRDVLAVPGSIFSETSKGVHRYLRHGATPIGSAADILDALGIDAQPAIPLAHAEGLDPSEARVLAILREPLPRDELIRALGMSAADAGALLSRLELAGLLAEDAGMIRALR
ncbi:MAG TPA: DNA-processing protein DprA [Candidatus Paceibacterota bacterium]|nr:DNA-processing protein DprA [Candidatus Paceibacterota bacterium]